MSLGVSRVKEPELGVRVIYHSNTITIAGPYAEAAPKVKERYGDRLNEMIFNMAVRTPADEKAPRTIIRELQT